MEMLAFYYDYPEIAKKETRSITLLRNYEGIPAGQYFFEEIFCADAECNCSWVMIQVRGASGQLCATLRYGWESLQFYIDWNYGNEEWAHDCIGIDLYPLATQGQHSNTFLKIFKDIVESDKNYADRIRTHYQMVKKKQQEDKFRNEMSTPASMMREKVRRDESCLL